MVGRRTRDGLRDGDRLVGTLNNYPIFVYKDPAETIKFHIDDIIDCILADDEPDDDAISSGNVIPGELLSGPNAG